MKYRITLICLILSALVYAGIGNNNLYRIISRDDFNQKIIERKDVLSKRYLVFPSLDKNYRDVLTTGDESDQLAKFAYIFKIIRSEYVLEYINRLNPESPIFNLIKGLYFFSDSKYDNAIQSLKEYHGKEFEFLKLLLIADCWYEILPDKKDHQVAIKAYQQALDCTNDGVYKTLIQNRIKFLKYY